MEKLPREYTVLFNAVTDAVEALEAAVSALKEAQMEAEKEYLDKNDGPDEDFPIYHK